MNTEHQMSVSIRDFHRRYLHFPFDYKGKRYFARVEKLTEDGLFKIKQITPQIAGEKPSPLSFDPAAIPENINRHSDILTLRVLDGLRKMLEKRRILSGT